MDLKIKPLSVETLEDFLYFFDNITFDEHPGWSVCYCYSFHFVGTAEEWNNRDKNRAAVIKLIKDGHMQGYLAYYNGTPVGWCNANNKLNFKRLKLSKELWDETKGRICSIVCFLVSPEHRRKEIGTELLRRVCADYATAGYDYLEAYPHKKGIHEHCQGPPSMYKKLGFETIRELDESTIVRKKLDSAVTR